MARLLRNIYSVFGWMAVVWGSAKSQRNGTKKEEAGVYMFAVSVCAMCSNSIMKIY